MNTDKNGHKADTLKGGHRTARWPYLLLALVCLASFCLSARAVDRVTATLTVTAGTTNGQTLTVNGDVRTWTNNVVVSTSQILTNSTANGAKSNLLQHIGLNRFASITVADNGAASIQLTGGSGVAMTVTPSAGWATVTYATQLVAAAVGVRIPTGVEVPAEQTNINSGLLTALRSTANTNVFYESDGAVANLVGRTNSQTIGGNKVFSGTNAFTGNSNYVAHGFLANPLLTNGANYGTAFSSPGSGTSSEQFGSGATATGDFTLAVGPGATANGLIAIAIGNNARAVPASGDGALAVGLNASAADDSTTAIGPESQANFVGGTAIGYNSDANATNATALGKNALVGSGKTNSTAVGYNSNPTRANQVCLGNGEEVYIPGNLQLDGYATNFHAWGTTSLPAGADISFGRYALSSLANGNNADVPVGTNCWIEVSGPSAAFTIVGIDGQPNRDGKEIWILNQTGQNMTIANQSGVDATAGNRIKCLTGADKTVTGNSAAMLKYSAAESRWIVHYFSQ